MKNKFWLFLIFFFVFLFSLSLQAQEKNNSACELKHRYRYPIMQPDEKTLKEWIAAYNRAPKAWLDPAKMALAKKRGSLSLLSHVSYVASERAQGDCGNCWAWAGTGCLEVALDVLEGTRDRLSVQYINSCETQEIGKGRCQSGWLADVASFYTKTKKAVPWSNTNASWQDGDLSYEISCAMVSTTPNYSINSIREEAITTRVAQATAIANIKNILLQNKGVWFAFYLPNQTAWDDFQSFWHNQSESIVYNIDQYNGIPYDQNTGGGHAVLCVGYNDDDPNNSYWIMLNSWGNASGGRPNGLFRVNMDMNYAAVNTYYSFYWQDLAVQFNVGQLALNSFSLSDRTSGSTAYTKEREVNVSVSATGSPTQICFAPYSDCSGGGWYPYSSSGMTYTLPEGDGSKTVYCRVKKTTTESNILNDTIYLDTLAPAVNFTLDNHTLRSGDYITTQPALKAVITESVGVDTSSLKFTRDGADVSDGTAGGDGHYDSYDAATKTATYSFKSALTSGEHSIGFEVKDLAGNTTTLNFTGLEISSSLGMESVMNYPNPFTSTTNFSYQLSKAADVVIKIYTVRGELVKTLTAAAGSSSGQLGFNKIAWDGKDEAGSDLPNGIYLYTVTATDSQGSRVTKRSKVGITK